VVGVVVAVGGVLKPTFWGLDEADGGLEAGNITRGGETSQLLREMATSLSIVSFNGSGSKGRRTPEYAMSTPIEQQELERKKGGDINS
jgi:hypothetical protein